jgi:uncharacterized protein
MVRRLIAFLKLPIVLGLAFVATAGMGVVLAQPRHGGPARPGHGHGMMDEGDHHADMQGFMFLLAHREEIRRTVKEVAGGVETVTESDVPEVAAGIQDHVAAMYRRLKEGRPIHVRDPLFAELFRRAEKITMKTEKTPKGLKVRETSRDPYLAKLIRSHAAVVSAFLRNGHSEMMKNHPLPAKESVASP